MTDKNLESDKAGPRGEAVSDIVVASVFLVFAILMLIGATQFTYQSEMGFVTSAAFTPILLAVMVSIFCIILILEMLKRKTQLISFSKWLKTVTNDETVRRSGMLILFVGIYIVLVGVLNFILITFLFLCGIYWYLKIGKWYTILLYSLGNAALIAYIIPTIYQMPLP